jgi:hypothetical protein
MVPINRGNLVMPCFVVGLLVRHVNSAGYLLDRWLSQPELWQLERFRITAEGAASCPGRWPA